MHVNQAQLLLTLIGGTAQLVAGYDGHYWADNSTPKRQRTRGRVGGGTYGRSLMAHFDRKRFDAKRNLN
ncbi:MAG: hypothetical protein JWP44_5085 [Mucilaginibacter sp.]|nr:hypothetical protein [Mucilaginibacter sp.]